MASQAPQLKEDSSLHPTVTFPTQTKLPIRDSIWLANATGRGRAEAIYQSLDVSILVVNCNSPIVTVICILSIVTVNLNCQF